MSVKEPPQSFPGGSVGRLLKIQTLRCLLLPLCPMSLELVAGLRGFQSFSVFLQCYQGVVPVGRDSLGCQEAPTRPSLWPPRSRQLPSPGGNPNLSVMGWDQARSSPSAGSFPGAGGRCEDGSVSARNLVCWKVLRNRSAALSPEVLV